MNSTCEGTDASFRAGDRMDTKSCATYRHHTALGEPNSCQCVGCLIGGECTKWEENLTDDYPAQMERMK